MSLQARPFPEVPAETARVAKAALGSDHRYLVLRDQLGIIFDDAAYHSLFATTGQPALSPAQLILVCVLQFAEELSDRQAADAVASRLDWKYLLGLPLAHPGFDASVLSEFRTRVLAHEAEGQLMSDFLAKMKALKLLKAGGSQRTDATHMVAAVRQRNRLELVGETLCQALDFLAGAIPLSLQAFVPAVWFERYSQTFNNYRLPSAEAQRVALAEQIGHDGQQLLLWLRQESPELSQNRSIQALEAIWSIHYEADVHGQVRWRPSAALPPAADQPLSPYDLEARHSRKRQTVWVGYKSHLTETCDTPDAPSLITQVLTTPATTSDESQLPLIHSALAAEELLPDQHLVDSGYVDADVIVAAQQQYGLKVVAPVRADPSWQAKAGQGYASSDFVLDWQSQQASCPNGQRSVSWKEGQTAEGKAVVRISFDKATCAICPARAVCTAGVSAPRVLTLRPEAQHSYLQQQRRTQQTAAFKQQYAARAGIEGTISQAVRVADLRHARYRGLPKVHLQSILTALALNFSRLAAWFTNQARARTRISPFAALATT